MMQFRQIELRIPEELWDKLESDAVQSGCTLRQMIVHYLEANALCYAHSYEAEELEPTHNRIRNMKAELEALKARVAEIEAIRRRANSQ
jgi:hypothetical protein